MASWNFAFAIACSFQFFETWYLGDFSTLTPLSQSQSYVQHAVIGNWSDPPDTSDSNFPLECTFMDSDVTFDSGCSTFETVLRGDTRHEILKEVISRSKNLDEALIRLRGAIRSHQFRAGNVQVNLTKLVNRLDERTQKDGFHVLRDWDGKADRLLDESIPTDVLDFLGRSLPRNLLLSPVGGSATTILAILLDYYFLYI